MKVAVFSDVQANLPALEEAIEHIDAWHPDLVVMAGDLVNRGPDSLGCLERFAERRAAAGWLPVNGNHEQWVLECEHQPLASEPARELRRFTDWAWQQVAPRADLLRGWPDHLCFQPPGLDRTAMDRPAGAATGAAAKSGTGADAAPDSAPGPWVHVTHGSMHSNRDGITARVSDAALAEGMLPPDTALFVCGHTHRPLQRSLGATTIVNVGSVGQPFDGDPRLSYGRFTWRGGRWHSELVRQRYDRKRARHAFEDSGFLELGALAQLVYLEWDRAEVLIGGWRPRYECAVLAGEISLQRSVDDYLRERGISWRQRGAD